MKLHRPLQRAVLCVCFVLCPSVPISVDIEVADTDGTVRSLVASTIAGKSPEEAAAQFCKDNVYGAAQVDTCTAGLGAELARRMSNAYGNASAFVQLGQPDSTSTPYTVWPYEGEDPGMAARRWCATAHEQLAEGTPQWTTCVTNVRAWLWAALEDVHRARIEDLFVSRKLLPLKSAGDDAEPASVLEQAHGSVAVLRLRVRELTKALDAATDAALDAATDAHERNTSSSEGSSSIATASEASVARLHARSLASSLELLGLAELAAGFMDKAQQRFLEALVLAEDAKDALETEAILKGTNASDLDDTWSLKHYVRGFSEEFVTYQGLPTASSDVTADTTNANAPATLSAPAAVDAAVASRKRERVEAAALRQWWRAGRRPTDPGFPSAAKPKDEKGGLRHKRRPLPRLTATQLRARTEGRPPPTGANDDTSTLSSLEAAALRGEMPFVLTGAMDAWDWEVEATNINDGDGNRSDRIDKNGHWGNKDNGLLARLAAGWGAQRDAVEWFPEGIGSMGPFNPAPHRPSLREAMRHLLGGAHGYQPTTVDVAQGRGAYVHWGVSSKDWAGVLAAFAKPKEIAAHAAAAAAGAAGAAALAEAPVVQEANSPEAAAAAVEELLLPAQFGGQLEWMKTCFRDHDATLTQRSSDRVAAPATENGNTVADDSVSSRDNTEFNRSATAPPTPPPPPGAWRASLANFVGLMRWFIVYVGESGGGMFNHFDRHMTSAWQVQVRGQKRWHMCGPDQTPYMYGRAGVDVFNPDYDHSPLFLDADCFDDVVSAGEMVFYPGGWWHATQTLSTPTVSISALSVDPRNRKDFGGAIHEECTPSPSRPRPNYSPRLCQPLLEICLPLLEELYNNEK